MDIELIYFHCANNHLAKMSFLLHSEVHSQFGVHFGHQVVGHEAQALDEAADVHGAGRLDLGLAVVVQPGALVGQHQIGDVHPLDVAGQWHDLQQVGAVVVGVVAHHDAGVRLACLALASVGAVIDEPDITAPNELHALSELLASSPSVLSSGYVSCPLAWASPSSA